MMHGRKRVASRNWGFHSGHPVVPGKGQEEKKNKNEQKTIPQNNLICSQLIMSYFYFSLLRWWPRPSPFGLSWAPGSSCSYFLLLFFLLLFPRVQDTLFSSQWVLIHIFIPYFGASQAHFTMDPHSFRGKHQKNK